MRLGKALGKTQQSILSSLVEHKQWFGEGFGCGWIWTNYSTTRKLLDSLVKRGLAEVVKEKGSMPWNRDTVYNVYRPTEAGRRYERERIKRIRAERALMEGRAS